MTNVKITQTFDQLKEKGDKAFISYIVAGDGGLDKLKNQIQILENQGVDLIELGIPFSDPVADGPTIQEGAHRSIASGTTLDKILEELTKIKDEINVPIVFMSYLNPIYRMGLETFAKRAQKAGVAGVILPDVPYEEEINFKDLFNEHDISIIRLVTLTSSKERLKELTQDAEGFVYAVTLKGTTGVRSGGYDQEIYDYLEELKKISPIPVCAGFGIGSRETAEKVGSYCDGVIVGSKIVDYMYNGEFDKIGELIPSKNRV